MGTPNTLNQPITFETALCRGCLPLVIGQLDNCPGIPNSQFTGNPVTDWSLSGGLTQAGSNPLQVTGAANVSHTITQTVPNFAPGEYTLSWDVDNNDAGQLSMLVQIAGGPIISTSATGKDGAGNYTYTQNFTIPNVYYTGTYTITIALRQQMGTSPPVILDTTLNSLYICPANQLNTDFCFQLPMIQTGDELLSLPSSAVGYAYNFTSAVGYNDTEDDTGDPCSGTTFTSNYSFTPTCQAGATLGTAGDYFIEVDLGDVTIDYGSNPNDDTEGEVLLRSVDGAETYDIAITESDANTTVLELSTNGWNAADQPELQVRSKGICDGTDFRNKWDITVNEYSFIPNFYTTTFTAADDTFYRLKFDLAKTSNVTVTVTDSGGTEFFKASTTGPTFDKIFVTPSYIPTTTVTVKFEIFDLTEWPNADFNDLVLQNVSLYQYCPWTLTLEDQSEVTIDTLTETHYTVAEETGSSYHRNILYCLDVAAQTAACYYFRATNSCDTDENYLSNCVQICDDSCAVNYISWDHDNIKFIGNESLDLLNYDYSQYLYVKIDFQDLTQEWEGIYFNDAAYFLQNPYSAYRNTKVMQVWPLAGYARSAIAQGMTGTFYVDGVEYRKFDEESISPQFSAVEDSPMRVIVTKVGDFLQSRNA